MRWDLPDYFLLSSSNIKFVVVTAVVIVVLADQKRLAASSGNLKLKNFVKNMFILIAVPIARAACMPDSHVCQRSSC